MSYQYVTEKNTLFKKYKIWYWTIFILALSGNFSVSAANMPNSQELIQQLGIQQQDIASLNQGEIVFFNVTETNVKELTAGAAIYLPASPSKIFRFIKDKGLASIDTAVTAEGAIPLQATLATFKRFGFKSGSDEAANFLVATPGSQFNLSTQQFQAIKTTGSAQPDAASQAFRKILLQRWQAYRKNGLKGIATYDRGEGTEANPGEELRIATLPSGAEEKFFWRNREVQSRPTAILVHRVMLNAGGAGAVILVCLISTAPWFSMRTELLPIKSQVMAAA